MQRPGSDSCRAFDGERCRGPLLACGVAWLETNGGTDRRLLAHRTMGGRTSACDLRIPRSEASSEHAVVRWHESGWQIKDLGSTNGTTVDEQLASPGSWLALTVGSGIEFAGVASWTLSDAAPPSAAGFPEDGGDPVLASGEMLSLPPGDAPDLVVYREAGQGWVLEAGADARPVEDRANVEAGGRAWTLRLPADIAATMALDAAPLVFDQLELQFRHSPDEEHVELTGVSGQRSVDLEARAFHYLLLTLARARSGQLDDRCVSQEGGWVYQDDLARWLSIEEQKVNMDVFRARRFFESKGIVGAPAVVERRRGTRQLRLGTDAVVITVLGP